MGAISKIQWTHATFNPWHGCEKVSPGCANCYAERDAKRFGTEWGPNVPRRFFGDDHWIGPRSWDRAAKKAGERRRVFCASMADVFETREDLDDHRVRLFSLIRETPNLDWLLLTKRPESIAYLLGRVFGSDTERFSWVADWIAGTPPENVWLGTTVESQEWAERRIPHLLRIPAKVRFLSCEPLLGPIDFSRITTDPPGSGLAVTDGLGRFDGEGPARISWVIVGGESGDKARSMDVRWARDIHRQCREAGVAFFMKQMGKAPRCGDLLARAVPDPLDPKRKMWEWDDARIEGLGVAVNYRQRSPKGGDPEEWPEDLRVREFPR